MKFRDSSARIAVEVKARVNAATARRLAEHASAHPEVTLLLVTRESTQDARSILVDHGIGIIDEQGNAHLELPGFFLHVQDRAARRHSKIGDRRTRLRGKAGQVVQAMLLDSERAWQAKSLAEVADVSQRLAQLVFMRLEREGLLVTEGRGPMRTRRLTNPPALCDLWVEENDDHARTTQAHLSAETPRDLMGKIAEVLERAGVRYAFTGSAAANVLGSFPAADDLVIDVWVEEQVAPEDLFILIAGNAGLNGGQHRRAPDRRRCRPCLP